MTATQRALCEDRYAQLMRADAKRAAERIYKQWGSDTWCRDTKKHVLLMRRRGWEKQVLQTLSAKPLSMREIMDETGMTDHAARTAMRDLIDQGRVACVRADRIGAAGRSFKVNEYALVKSDA